MRHRARAAGVIASLAVVVAAAAGCGADEPSPTAGAQAASVERVASFAEPQRKAAPTLRGSTLTGSTFDLADHRGKVVVINVWASWCGPCIRETPDFVRVANDTSPSDVQFVGINLKDEGNGPSFVRRFRVPYPSVLDPIGEQLLQFRGVVPAAPPSTIVVDRQGRVAARAIGALTEASCVSC
jgi:thiol-disulfide isomerase/thioredoxin